MSAEYPYTQSLVDTDLAQLNWKPVETNGTVVGLENPRIGKFILHKITLNEKVSYDVPFFEPASGAGVVIIPVRKDQEGNHYVQSIVEWRPIEDEHGKRGTRTTSLPGGFGKKAGGSTEESVYEELLTEAGLIPVNITLIGEKSADRAFGFKPNKFVLVEYKESDEPANPEKLEAIMGKGKEYDIRHFPMTDLSERDGIITTAIGLARDYLEYKENKSNLRARVLKAAESPEGTL